jgi:S-adenosylmethionine synthetase
MNKSEKYLFTSEAVSHGHPDKICDQISDAILDAYLEKDAESRVAVETLVTKNKIVVAGEVKSNPAVKIDVKKVIRNTVEKIGYNNPKYGFSHKSRIYNFIHAQTPELQLNSYQKKAGDQGIMFGYACSETTDYMPLASSLANYILYMIYMVGDFNFCYNGMLFPDAKCQVTIEYENDIPLRIHTVVLSASHNKQYNFEQIKCELESAVMRCIKMFINDEQFATNLSLAKTLDLIKIKINPSGPWHNFGPAADSGVTGRKIVIDAYGGCAPVGGGAFSGKDGTKVDRTAAYMARHIAKNIVYNGIADTCLIELAYIIGEPSPVSVNVSCKNAKYTNEEIIEIINKNFDLSVESMMQHLNMRTPNYEFNCVYSHFGLNVCQLGNEDLRPWEKVFILKGLKSGKRASK